MQTIQTAILSFGMSGQVFHAPFITTHPGFNFYAVWERTKSIASGKYPNVKTFRTLEELLADAAVELVIVNTPNATHYEYAEKALLAGKHVIIEKPFTPTVAEGEALISIARSNNLVLSVFQNRRWDSDFLTTKGVIETGVLGDIVEASIHFDRYKQELSPKIHKEKRGPGTGVLYDLGSHIIDQALVLFGMPEKVFSDIRVVRIASQVDDYFELLLYYPALRVRLHCSYLVKELTPAYIINGTLGSFQKSRADVQETELGKGNLPIGTAWGREPADEAGNLSIDDSGRTVKSKVDTLQGNYSAYFENIYLAIRESQPINVTGDDALNVIRIIEAAQRSHETGCVQGL